ncbi:MAG TPA: ABC transporter permease [Rhodopila sp.]|nr:ABC transporter permease [Rhodopila sp.]
MKLFRRSASQPWILSFVGAVLVFAAAVVIAGGHGAGSMASAASSLAVFMVIVGLGQMFVVTLGPGNVDLSLPANIGLASAVAMKIMAGHDSLILLGILAAIGSGMVIGLVNYLLIAALLIPPIIATLSASFIIQTLDISYGRGLQVKPPPGFEALSDARILGLPALVLIALAVSAILAVVLHRQVFGRSVLAIGQNQRAAWLAGIAVGRIRCLTYILCGALGGLDGVLLAGYFRGSSVDIGDEYLLASIAVVVIGGTSVGGGRATVLGLWGAALFLVFLQIMLNTLGADAGTRLLLTGLVIIGVITIAGGGRRARS